MKYLLLFVVLWTILIYYIGLGAEILGRFKHHNWNIIGSYGRVTDANLYSNLYLIGLCLFLFFALAIRLNNKLKK